MSIGKLFISGLGVGLLLTVVQMLMVRFISARRGYVPIRTTRLTRGVQRR